MSSQATSHSPLATDSDEVLVRVEGVSKKFCRSLKRSLWYGICDIGAELNPFRRQVAGVAGSGLLVAGNGSRPDSSELATSNSPPVTDEAGLRPGEFYAVRDVSFELRRGECLGLIGHNGAGKTTLLKMLNGLIKPDCGRIENNGRVGALIALGAGFNPILTGRENIYINGSVLGLSKKEIDEKIDEIIDFAEIGDFIDMAVQNYSSGMQVRLGFAVATAMKPDVLLLDEVLAVGDGAFRQKCYERLDDIRSQAAIIFVSHNMPDVGRVCSSTIVMDKGLPLLLSAPSEGISLYNDLNSQSQRPGGAVLEMSPPIRGFRVSCPLTAQFSQPLELVVDVDSGENVGGVSLTVAFLGQTGGFAAVGINNPTQMPLCLRKGNNRWRCVLGSIPLRNGIYPLSIHINNIRGDFLAIESNCRTVKVKGASDLIPGECQLHLADISAISD